MSVLLKYLLCILLNPCLSKNAITRAIKAAIAKKTPFSMATPKPIKKKANPFMLYLSIKTKLNIKLLLLYGKKSPKNSY